MSLAISPYRAAALPSMAVTSVPVAAPATPGSAATLATLNRLKEQLLKLSAVPSDATAIEGYKKDLTIADVNWPTLDELSQWISGFSSSDPKQLGVLNFLCACLFTAEINKPRADQVRTPAFYLTQAYRNVLQAHVLNASGNNIEAAYLAQRAGDLLPRVALTSLQTNCIGMFSQLLGNIQGSISGVVAVDRGPAPGIPAPAMPAPPPAPGPVAVGVIQPDSAPVVPETSAPVAVAVVPQLSAAGELALNAWLTKYASAFAKDRANKITAEGVLVDYASLLKGKVSPITLKISGTVVKVTMTVPNVSVSVKIGTAQFVQRFHELIGFVNGLSKSKTADLPTSVFIDPDDYQALIQQIQAAANGRLSKTVKLQ